MVVGILSSTDPPPFFFFFIHISRLHFTLSPLFTRRIYQTIHHQVLSQLSDTEERARDHRLDRLAIAFLKSKFLTLVLPSQTLAPILNMDAKIKIKTKTSTSLDTIPEDVTLVIVKFVKVWCEIGGNEAEREARRK